MLFVSRAQWGARKPTSTSTDIRPVGVTIHWEGPRMGSFPHSECASKVRGIQAYHMDTKKWATIAYTAIVCAHGYVYEGRGVGQRTAANGTDHANETWYALCALAGEGDVTTPELLTGLDDAIRWLRDHGAGRLVNGHRDHKATACPGDVLYRWAHTGTHDGTTPPTEGDDTMTPLQQERIENLLQLVAAQAGRNAMMLQSLLEDDAPAPVLVDVDEEAIAGLILSELTPEAIAAAIPPGYAEQVVDVLVARLTKEA